MAGAILFMVASVVTAIAGRALALVVCAAAVWLSPYPDSGATSNAHFDWDDPAVLCVSILMLVGFSWETSRYKSLINLTFLGDARRNLAKGLAVCARLPTLGYRVLNLFLHGRLYRDRPGSPILRAAPGFTITTWRPKLKEDSGSRGQRPGDRLLHRIGIPRPPAKLEQSAAGSCWERCIQHDRHLRCCISFIRGLPLRLLAIILAQICGLSEMTLTIPTSTLSASVVLLIGEERSSPHRHGSGASC